MNTYNVTNINDSGASSLSIDYFDENGIVTSDASTLILEPRTITKNTANYDRGIGAGGTIAITAGPLEPSSELVTVDRFYRYDKGFHFYTADENESNIVQQESEAGNLSYVYEGESFVALNTNLGEAIEGAEPVYRFFNNETGAHLFTMDVNEKDYIIDNLDNYTLEGTAYYAFENEQENIPTMPVFRMLNGNTGSHLLTSDEKEFKYIQENLPHFSVEADNGIAFHVLDL